MTNKVNTAHIKKIIEEKLLNPSISTLENAEKSRSIIFDQYKLLVDSAHKIEERRNGTNNIFLGINSIIVSILTQVIPFPEVKVEKLLILFILLAIGIIVCLDWLWTIDTYRKINYVNYSLIKALEKSLPTSVFSLRTDIVDEQPENSLAKANNILRKETLLPVVFVSMYLTYFIFICLLLTLRTW